MQMCIYPPKPNKNPPRARSAGADSSAHERSKGQPVAWSCSEEAVMQLIRERDPFHVGLPSPVALRLLQVNSTCLLYELCLFLI